MKSLPLADAVAGLKPDTTGVGAFTVNVCGKGESNPPGLVTRIAYVPAPATALAGTVAVSCVKLTYVVVSGRSGVATTFEAGMKPFPVIVIVNPAAPIATLVGEIAVTVGADDTIGSRTIADELTPGVATVIAAEPSIAIRFAGIVVVNFVESTNVVGSGVVCQTIADCGVKREPIAVNVNAGPPVTAAAGSRLNSVVPRGSGLTIKINALVATAPGFFTEMPICPPAGSANSAAGTVAVSSAES